MMENENTIRQALEELEELEDNVNEYGWIITDEDDCLDPWRNEKKLKEGLDVVDWSSVIPCDILYCETSVQHDWEELKRRPVLVLYKSGTIDSPKVYGLQVTSTPKGNGYRSKFKYELKDWREIGLRKPSYINYDHIVKNETNDIRNTNNARITKRDAKGLLECIEKDYEDLIRLGYKSTYDKELLDDFIDYLRAI